MNHDHINMDDSLLLLYLTGKASGEEQAVIAEWLNADEKNRKHLDQLETLWIETGKLDPPPMAVDTMAAWEKMSDRIDKQSKQYLTTYSEGNIVRMKYLRYAMRLAAMLVIAFGAIAVYWFALRPARTMEIVSTTQITRDTLPDGSQVALNVGSRLILPRKFKGNIREVTLEGQAWFGVTRDSTKPFVIKAGDAGIRVLGTEFEVRAYPGKDVFVSVTKGRVMLFHADERSGDTLSVILGAGEQGVLPVNAARPEMVSSQAPDDLYWLNHSFDFRQTPLSEVFAMLKKYYNVEIRAADERVLQCRLSARFAEEPVDRVLQVIAESFGLEVKVEDHTYVFYGSGC